MISLDPLVPHLFALFGHCLEDGNKSGSFVIIIGPFPPLLQGIPDILLHIDNQIEQFP